MNRNFLILPWLIFFSFALHSKTKFPTDPNQFLRGKLERDSNRQKASTYPLPPSSAMEIRLMTYNLENLFDTEPDSNKDDFEYLPISNEIYTGPISQYRGKSYTQIKNKGCLRVSEPYRQKCLETHWSPEVFDAKLEQIRKAYNTLYGQREFFPDINIYAEVENIEALARLAHKLGYTQSLPQTFAQQDNSRAHYEALKEKGSMPCQNAEVPGLLITNSDDDRGIDVAMLFRPSDKLQMLSCTEHFVDLSAVDSRTTRNVLAVTFLVGGDQKLTVIGNHWRSQSADTPVRNEEARQLRILADQYATDSKVLIAGDLNTIKSENPHPVLDTLIGGGNYTEMFRWAEENNWDLGIPGSYYYSPNVSWNHLDRLVLHKNLSEPEKGDRLFAKRQLRAVMDSFRVLAPRSLMRPKSISFFRNRETANAFEKATGKQLQYKNIADEAENSEVTSAFQKNPNLDILDVVEAASPNRFYHKFDKGSLRVDGVSDHFPLALTLSWKP